ncbi:MAG: DEAD/DEAH box helicase, partial [Chloroflexi bacterium]|nr:DEAD/DEAH box helicase [Chloroflexota bacterium]
VKRPPHILITTPESLFILLTSESGRRGLRSVRTLILDEIHAVADDKRGSHLSLSVERLCALADGSVTRIGLSATQRPIEEMARFLVGTQSIDAVGVPNCLIVDTGHVRALDIGLELPQRELGPIATHELWAETLDRIASLVREHKTTLVFVNTRRLVERVAHQLSQRLGEESVVAHHGSLSRKTRHAAEQRLRRAEVKVCVATASLELGIDIGAIDLVCQVGSPRSISTFLQRTGRSGHFLSATPKGRLFPLTRDELLECMALLRAVGRRDLESLSIPQWPLDVLAQQIVAACACEEWREDDLFALCRRAYSYGSLPREKFDQVIEMLAHGAAHRQGRRSAYLHRDAIHHVLRGRRGARIAALTSGGAIPDNADYEVIADPEGIFVGTVNEDFAVESVAGDVFLLGNTPWRIRRVERGRVRVEDAQGATPTVPFWLGEAPGRTRELSEAVSELREGIAQRLEQPGSAEGWLRGECGVSPEAAEQAVRYVAEGARVLSAIPTARRVIAERFFDESGGMQLVIHAPFGARINRAWGMALRKRICRTFDFELQAAATDDGINLSLGPGQSFPLADTFRFLSSKNVEEVLLQAVFQAPLFGIRWRWDAARALALLRFTGGRRVPPPLQRMRAEDLLAAVFPEQVACQDNAMPGDIVPPDHPLVFETVRDCLTEAMDVEGLKAVLAAIERGEIEVLARDTMQPSVFAHQILNAMPYAFLDDAPLEERRARAVALRRALPEDIRDLGTLDPEEIRKAAQDAWPRLRNAEELHDALLTLGVLPVRELGRRATEGSPAEWEGWFQGLMKDQRALRVFTGDGETLWTAMECAPLVFPAFPGVRFDPALLPLASQGEPLSEEEATLVLVRGWVESSGPFAVGEMEETLRLPPGAVAIALARLEGQGLVLRGRFTPGRGEEEFCDRRILARIHRMTIARLRQETRPVPPATFIRFLFRWQHATGASRLRGEDGLFQVIEQLQGFEAAAASWESHILPLRVADYDPLKLDRLCFAGEVVWGRLARRETNGERLAVRTALTRSGPLTLALREDLPWLLDQTLASAAGLSGAAEEVLAFLARNGASFFPDIVAGTRRLPSEVEEALWQLVAAGRVTADAFSALRSLITGSIKRSQRRPRFGSRPRRRFHTSRWSLLQSVATAEDVIGSKALQLLKRYGMAFPELLAREPMAPPWRSLVQWYRRAEARGEIRGGRFVDGFIGEQFALPEAIDLLRAVGKSEPAGELLRVSACDALNLVGVLTPGPRVPAVPGNYAVFRDGVPIASMQSGQLQLDHGLDQATAEEVRLLVAPRQPAPAILAPAGTAHKTAIGTAV